MIAQPGVALYDQFLLTAPLSPVEQAIIDGAGSALTLSAGRR
jgi:hypothetical protein